MSTETVAAAIPASVDTAAAAVSATGGSEDAPNPVETPPQTPETDVAVKRAVTLEEVRAARKAAEASKSLTTEPPKTETPKTDAPKTDVKVDEVTQFARLSKELREAKAALKAAEAKGSVAGVAEKVQKLIAEGKHLEALAAAGIDLDTAVTQQLGLPPGTDAAGKTDAEKRIEELERRLAERDTKEQTQNTAARTEHAMRVIGDHVAKNAAEFTYLSRNPAWIQEAYLGAEEAFTSLTRDGKVLTNAEKDSLVLNALKLTEQRYAELSKYFTAKGDLGQAPSGAPVSPASATQSPATFDASMRGGTVRPAVSKKLTWDELRTQRRNDARQRASQKG
jgi:hypothetical protein